VFISLLKIHGHILLLMQLSILLPQMAMTVHFYWSLQLKDTHTE